MIPCSDYPPTESGETERVGRIEGGASEDVCTGYPLAEGEASLRRRGIGDIIVQPSDLDAPHPSSSAPSLVDELMGLVEDYAAELDHGYSADVTAAKEALRSRLTALETELREAKSVNDFSRGLRCEEYTVREMVRGDNSRPITQVTTYDDDTRNWIIREYEGASLSEALQRASRGESTHEEIKPHEFSSPNTTEKL